MHTRHRGEAGPGTINYRVLGAIRIYTITITLVIIITCVSIIDLLRIRVILLRSVQIQIYFLVRFNLINSPRNHPVRNAALRFSVLHHMAQHVNDIVNAIHFIKTDLQGLPVPYLLCVYATTPL